MGTTMKISLHCRRPGFLKQTWNRGVESFSGFHSKISTEKAADVLPEESILVRDFIQSALYDPSTGYFAARSDAVGSMLQPIDFNRLNGRRAYTKHIDMLYKQGDRSWFTPVELFQPWYAYALGEFILRVHNPTTPLTIYEIGGGTGTCARNIMDYVKMKAPANYDTLTYTSVEISSALANEQLNKVGKVESHRSHFHVDCRSARDRNGWGPVKKEVCFVIMLEVLDNLPHDLVYREFADAPWMETTVTESHSGDNVSISENLRPLQDPLIQCYLDIMSGRPREGSDNILRSMMKDMLKFFLTRSELQWIPTGCLQLLETLYEVRPNMVLITSDFSSLPDVKVAGERAPLVASKVKGHTKDHSTYLHAKGYADIFFPTDFTILQRLNDHFAARNGSLRHSSILTTDQFMEQFANVGKTRTRDGYNPLLEDFSNTKFYINTPLSR